MANQAKGAVRSAGTGTTSTCWRRSAFSWCSRLSLRLLAGLCGDDRGHWDESTGTAIAALQARKRLWDGVLAAL